MRPIDGSAILAMFALAVIWAAPTDALALAPCKPMPKLIHFEELNIPPYEPRGVPTISVRIGATISPDGSVENPVIALVTPSHARKLVEASVLAAVKKFRYQKVSESCQGEIRVEIRIDE